MAITPFIDDDGYLLWLANPARGERWTGDYIKVCSDDAMEIEGWARRKTGATPEQCRICH